MEPAYYRLATSGAKGSVHRRAGAAAVVVAAFVLLVGALPVAAREPAAGNNVQGRPPAPAAKSAKKPARVATREPSELRPVKLKDAPTATVTASTTTFNVNTTVDAPLGSVGDTSCVDAEVTPMCSLRAAIEAANNLGTPVEINLPAGEYALDGDSYGQLAVHNKGGTSIVGADPETTIISLATGSYSVLMVDRDTSGSGGTLWLTSLSLTGGNGVEYGGGLSIKYGNDAAVLKDVSIYGNSARRGGGVACGTDHRGGGLWITDSVISGNTASDEGGGLWEYWCGITIKKSQIVANTADGSQNLTSGFGGGIYAEFGSFQINNTEITANTAGISGSYYGEGAGVYNYYAVLNGSKVTIDNNLAASGSGSSSGQGAGILLYAGFVELNKSSISNNTAEGASAYGSAVLVDYSGSLSLHETNVDDNVSEWDGNSGECYYGGAIYLYGYGYGPALTMDQGSTLNRNTGGGLFVYASDGSTKVNVKNSEINWNTAPGDYSSAGVCAYVEYGSAGIRLKKTDVKHNTATGDYSAGAIMAYMYEYGGIDVHVKGGSISNNESTGYGGTGAISIQSQYYGGGQLEIENARLANNVAGDGGYGGAIYAYNDDDYAPVEVTLTGVDIDGNQAGSETQPGTGGGLAVYYETAVEVRDSKIRNNTAVGSDSSSAYGGGVYLATYMTSSFTKTKINGNRATGSESYGGGVYTSGYADRFARSTIANNSARYGAGLLATTGYTLQLFRSTVSGNVAGDDANDGMGGGLYLADTSLLLTNSTIANNVAAGSGGSGGGIYDEPDAAAIIDFSTIAFNSAAVGAGFYAGVVSSPAGATIRGSILAHNTTEPGGSAEWNCYSQDPPQTILNSGGHNVLTDETCVVALSFGDQAVSNAKLKPLAKNGGPTKTIELKKGSPALSNGGKNCPPKDQRGVKRPNRCDSGAYER